MKLVIAIVQDEDTNALVENLMENEYRVTKLSTTGGFLKSGNSTLLIGVEEENVENVLDIIKEQCKTRSKTITSTPTMSGISGVFMPYPIDVNVGGATVFVVDVDQFVKV